MRLQVYAEIRVLSVIAEVVLLQHGVVEPPRQTTLLHMLHLQMLLLMLDCDILATFGVRGLRFVVVLP